MNSANKFIAVTIVEELGSGANNNGPWKIRIDEIVGFCGPRWQIR